MLHAVVVGIDEYIDRTIPPLRCAAKDATALADLLDARIKHSERNVRRFINQEATHDAIDEYIGADLPRDVEDTDVVLLYFACHGSPERRAPVDKTCLYLIPHDTTYNSIYSKGFDIENRVSNWLKRLSHVRLLVAFIDACFSGAAGGRSFTGPFLRERPNLKEYLDDEQPISFKDLKLGRGAVIISAADEDQIAREAPETLGHGVFTYYLLQALQRDRGGARHIDLLEIYREIDDGVRRATNDAQHPVLHTRSAANPKFPSLA